MRSSLASEGRPRLLLLEDGPPPVVTDPLEDWIRLPADDSEMWARVESLRQRWEAPRKPRLDENGVLTWGDRWVALSPIEARLTAVMLEKFSSMVSPHSLVVATKGTGDVRRNSLDVQLHRLRRRLAPIGLVIRTVRRRGYVLEAS
jgi:DNA-binding response OmpR family regulator